MSQGSIEDCPACSSGNHKSTSSFPDYFQPFLYHLKAKEANLITFEGSIKNLFTLQRTGSLSGLLSSPNPLFITAKTSFPSN